jgi:hypothetical protein
MENWTIVACVLVFFAGASAWLRLMKNREGFSANNTPIEMATLLQKNNNQLADALNISKYRNNYEDLVIHLDEWADLQMIDCIVKGKLGTVELNATAVEQFNALAQFKTNLNSAMKFLDNTGK